MILCVKMCEIWWYMMNRQPLPAIWWGQFAGTTQFDVFFCVVILLNTIVTPCCNAVKNRNSALGIAASKVHLNVIFYNTCLKLFHLGGLKKPLQSKDGLRAAVRWASKRLWFELPTFRCACKPLNCQVILCAPPSKKKLRRQSQNLLMFKCIEMHRAHIYTRVLL